MRRPRIKVPSSPEEVESPAIVKLRHTVPNEGEGFTVSRIPPIVARSKNVVGAVGVNGQRIPDGYKLGATPGLSAHE